MESCCYQRVRQVGSQQGLSSCWRHTVLPVVQRTVTSKALYRKTKRNSKQLSLTHRRWAPPLWRQRRSQVKDKWKPWEKCSAAISIILAFFPVIGNPLCPRELLNTQKRWWKLRHCCINVMPPFMFFNQENNGMKLLGFILTLYLFYLSMWREIHYSFCWCRWNYNNNVPPVFDSWSLFFFFCV